MKLLLFSIKALSVGALHYVCIQLPFSYEFRSIQKHFSCRNGATFFIVISLLIPMLHAVEPAESSEGKKLGFPFHG